MTTAILSLDSWESTHAQRNMRENFITKSELSQTVSNISKEKMKIIYWSYSLVDSSKIYRERVSVTASWGVLSIWFFWALWASLGAFCGWKNPRKKAGPARAVLSTCAHKISGVRANSLLTGMRRVVQGVGEKKKPKPKLK